MNNAARLRALSETSRARLLESVVVNANDAVVITEAEPIDSPGPRIIYVNPAFTRMTGYTTAEVIGKTPRILQGLDSGCEARTLIREALAAWQPVTAQLINYRKDGRKFWVELSIAPVADETGYFTHWISVQRDITERRIAEEGQLRARIAAANRIALKGEIEQRENVEAQLAYSVVHDSLTGLHNRAAFIERIEAAIARSQADSGYQYSVIHLDLDSFRYINDRLGYRTGDRILCDVARRIEGCAGEAATVARIAGDDFAVLLPATSPGDALVAADRLLIEIAARPKFDANDVVIATSIGIVHSQSEYEHAEAVLRDADTALLRARTISGNAFVVFTAEMRAEANLALRTRNDLHGAVGRGEFLLYGQPLIDTAMGHVYGFEALVRWKHPERGLVSPAEFIPIAEATGTMIEIGRWVLFEGCRMACRLQERAGRPILMSINVSSQQLLHSDFIADLESALATTGVDPHTIQLEITESVFLAGASVVGALIARIREFGVLIALDDFGTGYSSLSYLENFQIDTLKIDQSFVARIDDASAKSEIVRMIISLAHALGVDVVAEGIETRAQRAALGQLGCTHLQGYLYSRPLPPAEAADLFNEVGVEVAKLDLLLRETLLEVKVPLSTEQRAELRAQVHHAFDTHYAWMERLTTAASTGNAPFDLDKVAREDLCPIGIWLNSTISDSLQSMPLYFVSKARHAVFHRNMARFLAAVVAKQPAVALSLRRDGTMAMAAAALVRTLHDWLAIAELTGSLDDGQAADARSPYAADRVLETPVTVSR